MLDHDGAAIGGLYAAGNAMACATGMVYGGAGGTLGPAITFGYLAGAEARRAGGGTPTAPAPSIASAPASSITSAPASSITSAPASSIASASASSIASAPASSIASAPAS